MIFFWINEWSMYLYTCICIHVHMREMSMHTCMYQLISCIWKLNRPYWFWLAAEQIPISGQSFTCNKCSVQLIVAVLQIKINYQLNGATLDNAYGTKVLKSWLCVNVRESMVWYIKVHVYVWQMCWKSEWVWEAVVWCTPMCVSECVLYHGY